MIIVAGTIHVQPDKREVAIKAAQEVAAVTQQEAGCLTYNFYADISDENCFLVYEEWESNAALQTHLAAAHTQTFSAIIPTIIAKPPNIKKYWVDKVTDLRDE